MDLGRSLEISMEEERIQRLQSRMRNDGDEHRREQLAREVSEGLRVALEDGMVKEGSSRMPEVQILESLLDEKRKTHVARFLKETSAEEGQEEDAEVEEHAEDVNVMLSSKERMTDEEKRKEAVKTMNAALEKITIQQILEYRNFSQPPPLVVELVLAVLCLITQIDETVEEPVQTWPEAIKIFRKPGHFVNSLRRFPYAVDSGRVRAKNRRELPPLDQFTEDGLNRASLLSVYLYRWLLGALDYYDLTEHKVPQSSLDPTSPLSQQHQQQRTSETQPLHNQQVPEALAKSGAAPDRPSTAQPTRLSNDMQFSQPRPSSATASTKKKPSSNSAHFNGTWNKAQADARVTASTVASAGTRIRGSHNSRSVASTLRQSLKTDDGAEDSIRRSTTSQRARGSRLSTTSLPANPTFMNVQMDETQLLVDQAKKEVRELKSLESKSRWNMIREEKKNVEQRAHKAESELRRWRWQEADDMKKFVSQREYEIRERELLDSKDFQGFKRQCKARTQEEESKYIQEAYQEHKVNSKWEMDLKKCIMQERTELVKQRIKTYEDDRTHRVVQSQLEKMEAADARTLEQRQQALMVQKQLAKEKECLLQNLKYVHDRQQAPLSER